jgi:rhomboid protease GluP
LQQYPGQRQSFSASISGSPATSVIVALNIVFFIGVMITGGPGTQNLLNWGAKYGPYIAEGEYWRLAMPMFLHVGLFHMLTNLFGLIIFGSIVERTFGTMNFVVVYLSAGVMGNVVSFLAGPNPGVGASGAVFGILGAFGVYLLMNRRLLGQMGRQQLTSIGVIVAINVVLGLATTGIDNAAHFGGLLAGGLVAYLIAPRERLYAVDTPFNFGTARMALRAGPQPASRVVVSIAVIVVLAIALTWFESSTYVTNILGHKVPG